MVGPDFEKPAAPVSKGWIDSGAAEIARRPSRSPNWWAALGDPVLTRLVKLAQDQNPKLLAAGVRVIEARAQLGVAIGEFYPQQQQATASLAYNRIPGSVPYKLDQNEFWQATFGAQMAWEIDVWGKIRRGIESADEAFLGSVADYDDVLVTLIGDVASTYVKIRTFEAQLAIARDNLARQQQALRIAEARFKGGVVTKRDVYQAENVLGSTEASIPKLNLERRRATNALSVLLGLPPEPLDRLLAGGSGIPVAPEQLALGIPADLLRRRPDIRKAELKAAAQCAQIGVAKSDLYPAFYLTGYVGTLSTDIGRADLGRLFNASTLAYSVGPQVKWNILNYGQITNNIRVQDAKLQEYLVDYRKAVLTAQEEVENGIAEFGRSREEAASLRKSVAAAEGALNIALLEYKEGVADFTTVLNAEQSLFKAQDDLASTEGRITQGVIKAYRAMGGGWELRQDRDFVPEATRREMARRTDWGEWLTPGLLRPAAPGLPEPKDKGPAIRPPEW
jgi:NodT family efflux transporter outer membrane factor (OMF) lipoprotein